MNIDIEPVEGEVHTVEAWFTSYSNEDSELHIQSIPSGLSNKFVESYILEYHSDELAIEFLETKAWSKSGMEFHHYN